MPADDKKAVVRRFFDEVFNQQSQGAANEIISSTFVAHHPAFPEGIRGPEGIMQIAAMFRAGFPTSTTPLTTWSSKETKSPFAGPRTAPTRAHSWEFHPAASR
jgi:hypothetical protein